MQDVKLQQTADHFTLETAELLSTLQNDQLAPYEWERVKKSNESLIRNLQLLHQTTSQVSELRQNPDNAELVKDTVRSQIISKNILQQNLRGISAYHYNRLIQISKNVVEKVHVDEKYLNEKERDYYKSFQIITNKYLQQYQIVGYRESNQMLHKVRITKQVDTFIQASDGEIVELQQNQIYEGFIEDCEQLIQDGYALYV